MNRNTLGRLLILVLVIVNVIVFVQWASAHWWWRNEDCHYFIEESVIEVWKGTAYFSTKQAVLNDWASNTDLSLPTQSSHDDPSWGEADISMISVSDEDVTWRGLAQTVDLDLDNDYCGFWPNWAEIDHGHAYFNWYGFMGTTGTGPDSDVRGVYCQEVGHLFGLGHSVVGEPDGCMGKGYVSDSNVVGPHEIEQINSFY